MVLGAVAAITDDQAKAEVREAGYRDRETCVSAKAV